MISNIHLCQSIVSRRLEQMSNVHVICVPAFSAMLYNEVICEDNSCCVRKLNWQAYWNLWFASSVHFLDTACKLNWKHSFNHMFTHIRQALAHSSTSIVLICAPFKLHFPLLWCLSFLLVYNACSSFPLSLCWSTRLGMFAHQHSCEDLILCAAFRFQKQASSKQTYFFDIHLFKILPQLQCTSFSFSILNSLLLVWIQCV